MKREDIDFHAVLPQHARIHDRLINWALWSHSNPKRAQAPIWMLGKPAQHWDKPPAPAIVDVQDALRLERAICKLPETHRKSLIWSYILRSGPKKIAGHLEVSFIALRDLVHSARQMLANRGE
jgi:DNA-directed RNA polymerase specialized sigma24 family protein